MGSSPVWVSASAVGPARADTQSGSLAAQINQAAQSGRRGETALLSLIAFGGDRLAATDPAAMTAALGGLTSVGLGKEAHDIALQAAVLIGL